MPDNPGGSTRLPAMTPVQLAAVLCCALASWSAQAQTYPTRQRQSEIKQRIKQAVDAAIPVQAHVTIGATQALSEMAPCPRPPQVQIQGQGRYRDARVHCPDQGWQLYIPVTVKSRKQIVIARHDLAAGQVLKGDDLKLTRAAGMTGHTHTAAHSLNAVEGRALRAPVSAGTPIALTALQNGMLVHSGQSITVHVISGPVTVKTTAIALQAGRKGQSILVKNPSSGHRYRVTVTQHGAVDKLTW